LLAQAARVDLDYGSFPGADVPTYQSEDVAAVQSERGTAGSPHYTTDTQEAEMQETVAFVMSWYVLVLGLSFLVQARRWNTWIKQIGESAHELHLVLIYALVLLAGLVVVAAHNVWVLDWPVVITVFGWGMAIKGALMLLFTPLVGRLTDSLPANAAGLMRVVGAIWTVLGAILVYGNVIA
jgi:hypothetical protein